MIQEIRYQGLAANPSDYECQDGQLALSLNLIQEDGALKPVFQPRTKKTNIGDSRIVCIHETASFSHLILIDNNTNKVMWIDQNDHSLKPNIHDTGYILPAGITKAVPIGNALCFLAHDGIYKFLWTEDNANKLYLYLDKSIPSIKISFGLNGGFERVVTDNVTYSASLQNDLPIPNDSGIKTLNNAVLSKVNKLLADIRKNGKFSMPFFIRYALRLYDGSLACHSAPILMLPSTDGSPVVQCSVANHSHVEENTVASTFKIFAPAFDIDMKVEDMREDFEKFKDIIKSVDIFVSAPLYSYDQNGDCKTFSPSSQQSSSPFGVFSHTRLSSIAYPSVEIRAILAKYSEHFIDEAIRVQYGEYSDYMLQLPHKSEDVIRSQFEACSSFYLIKSIPFDEVGSYSDRKTISVDGSILESLEARESMSDDFDSHSVLSAENAFSYNSRILFSGIKKRLPNGYFNVPYRETFLHDYSFNSGVMDRLHSYTNGFANSVSDNINGFLKILGIYTHIKRDGKTYVVKDDLDIVTSSSISSRGAVIPFFFYPDSNACKVDIRLSSNDEVKKISFSVGSHPTLNGASFFNMFTNVSFDTFNTFPTPTDDNTVSLPNRIYVSEVNNPFLFPAQSIVSVGTGKVIGLSTAAQALSQGQFGSFPLYAFTTDGVWALSTSSTGSFVAVQPITRDVCVNAESITQLDGSVLFATSRGIMLISGSQVRCISDSVATDTPFHVESLTHALDLHRLVHPSADHCLPIAAFSKFLTGARMIYDYIHQRVVVFNPDKDNYSYAYVWSLKSMEWGMMASNIAYTVNSYPEALAVTHDNTLVSFDEYNEIPIKTMFVTRPLKLGGSDVLKSIHSVYQRGYFRHMSVIDGKKEYGDVNTVLYGSRDMFNWFLVGSSKDSSISRLHGTPYKYYRLAGVATLDTEKSLSGATIDVIPRENTKLH